MTSIAPLTHAVPPEIQARLKKSAEDFTSVALGELLQPMFDTADTAKGPFGGGAAEEQFKPLLVSEIAKQIAHTGGLGLTEPIYQQMLRLQEART
jgi:Rod binding domain-containing protein